ncbi:shikimate kinase [Desnuesiella massiliensis]|uniref:shikimate kinase n=1 Tax=Desnuesiella massiliensis TaxID=1650662 RepID=UPI0006E1EBD7|nr:shikimate kinase [Desnuesiella massiliensis]
MKENIILIGMPGSGKSTIGKLLSEKIEYDFIDMDNYIEEKEGIKIPDIFRLRGEAYFRKKETELLNFYKSLKGYVISTGGGTPIYNNNLHCLRQMGTVIFLDLDIGNIVQRVKKQDLIRPLLKDGVEAKLIKLYEDRIDIYRKAHIIINCNNLVCSQIVETIIKVIS